MKGRNQYILYLINFIVFILLETVALRLISHNSVLQRTELVKSISTVTNVFSGGAGNISRYFSLGKVNRRLAEENVQLRRENDRLRAAVADVFPTDSVMTKSSLFDYIPAGDDSIIFERGPLERLAAEGKMMAYRHTGFWKPMDTLRDNNELNAMWNEGKAPWKVW